jgi:isoleucyl-tRNA synthetase
VVLTEIAEGDETELEGLRVELNVSANQKCERCWHRRDDVGAHSEHPALCGRCVENIAGEGEVRQFA